MSIRLNSGKLRQLINNLLSELPLEECATCECTQGFLMRLSLDDEHCSEVLKPLLVTPAEMMTESLKNIREEKP